MEMACDAALKNRKYDADGRLHILRTPISKATVNPYYGREIPGGEKLGLVPERVYYMLRDPGELAKAAPSFARIQLMFKHIAVSSEDPKQDSIAGTVGSEVAFEAPYLVADLCIWDSEAIAGVETDTVRELSASYRYRADMTPGVYEGARYDGVMRDIQGNHVALVKSGRAGSDVMAADSEMETNMADKKAEEMANKVAGDKKAKDRIARDAQTAEERAMWAQMRKDGTADDPEDDSMPASLRKKAKDAEEDEEEEELEKNNPQGQDKRHAKDWEFDDWAKDQEDDSEEAKDRRKARDAEEDEEDKAKRKEFEKKAEDAEKMCRDSFDDLVDKLQSKGYSKEYATKVAGKVAAEKGETGHAKDRKAKDAEEERKAEDKMKHAMDEFKAELRESEDARRAVRPVVGDVLALDSAEEIYGFALDEMGVDHKGVRGVKALRALFNLARDVSKPKPKPQVAYDSKVVEEMFPSATRKINVM